MYSSLDQIRKTVANLIARGRTEQVLRLLQKVEGQSEHPAFQQIVMIAARYAQLNKSMLNGTTDDNSANIDLQRINASILSVVNGLESGTDAAFIHALHKQLPPTSRRPTNLILAGLLLLAICVFGGIYWVKSTRPFAVDVWLISPETNEPIVTLNQGNLILVSGEYSYTQAVQNGKMTFTSLDPALRHAKVRFETVGISGYVLKNPTQYYSLEATPLLLPLSRDTTTDKPVSVTQPNIRMEGDNNSIYNIQNSGPTTINQTIHQSDKKPARKQ